MKRTIGLVLAMAMVSFWTSSASALEIIFDKTFGQTIQIEEVTDLSDWQSQVFPIIMGSIRNDGKESVTFSVNWLSVSWGNFYLNLLTDFMDLGPITLAPGGQTAYTDVLRAGAFTEVIETGNYYALPVGTKDYIYSVSLCIDGVEYGYPVASNPMEFLWEIEVVAKDSGGGTNPVPEPTTLLLFGAGLAGLAAVGRKKNKI